jgi:hypothetical protein
MDGIMSSVKIIKLGEGYNDFYARALDSETITYYEYASGGDYDYDFDSAIMTDVSGTGSYDAFSQSVRLQQSSQSFDTYFDTINLVLLSEEIKSNTLELFIKSLVSLTNLKVSYSTNGNYTYVTDKRELRQGKLLESGALENATVRKEGSKQYVTLATPINSKLNSGSIKFRIEVKMVANDIMFINSIKVRQGNLAFIGGEDA